MTLWETTIEMSDGTGRMELRGGGAVDGLYIDGRPIAMHWPDCSGSVGQEFYRVEGMSLEDRTAQLRALVENGRRRNYEPLKAGLFPLLQQFPDGSYRVLLEEIERECWMADYQHLHDGVRCYYPLGNNYDPMTTFLPTQPDSALNPERIAHWKQVIQKGCMRPFAITVREEDTWNEYILDGHHKLHAYLELGKKPWRLCIQISPQRPILKGDWPGQEGVPYPRAWEWIFRQER